MNKLFFTLLLFIIPYFIYSQNLTGDNVILPLTNSTNGQIKAGQWNLINAYGSKNVYISNSGNFTSPVADSNFVGGWGAFKKVKTGSRNVILGTYAGRNITHADGTVWIGNEVGGDSIFAELDNIGGIDNSDTICPLIYFDFVNNIATICGTLNVNNGIIGDDSIWSINYTLQKVWLSDSIFSVGIGTSNPNGTLEVVGSVLSSGVNSTLGVYDTNGVGLSYTPNVLFQVDRSGILTGHSVLSLSLSEIGNYPLFLYNNDGDDWYATYIFSRDSLVYLKHNGDYAFKIDSVGEVYIPGIDENVTTAPTKVVGWNDITGELSPVNIDSVNFWRYVSIDTIKTNYHVKIDSSFVMKYRNAEFGYYFDTEVNNYVIKTGMTDIDTSAFSWWTSGENSGGTRAFQTWVGDQTYYSIMNIDYYPNLLGSDVTFSVSVSGQDGYSDFIMDNGNMTLQAYNNLLIDLLEEIETGYYLAYDTSQLAHKISYAKIPDTISYSDTSIYALSADHDSLDNLLNDAHTQYALLAGRDSDVLKMDTIQDVGTGTRVYIKDNLYVKDTTYSQSIDNWNYANYYNATTQYNFQVNGITEVELTTTSFRPYISLGSELGGTLNKWTKLFTTNITDDAARLKFNVPASSGDSILLIDGTIISKKLADYLKVEVDGSTTNELQDLEYHKVSGIMTISSGDADTINLFASTNRGLVPASGGGTTNFMRADGTWAIPPGTAVADNLGNHTMTQNLITDEYFINNDGSNSNGFRFVNNGNYKIETWSDIDLAGGTAETGGVRWMGYYKGSNESYRGISFTSDNYPKFSNIINGDGYYMLWNYEDSTVYYIDATYLTAEVDGSITNEGILDVADYGTTGTQITSNTSTSPRVTLESQSSNLTIEPDNDTINFTVVELILREIMVLWACIIIRLQMLNGI